MAQTQRRRRTEELTPAQRLSEAQKLITEQLKNNGYTAQEAAEIVRLARTMISTTSRQPRPEPLRADNPLHRRLGPQVLTQARDAMIAAYQSTESPARVVMGRLYERPIGGVQMTMVPAPVTQYRNRYRVEVAGRTYTLDANQSMQLGGIITRPDQTDAGRLMTLLENQSVPNSDLRITDENGSLVSRAQFVAAVRPRYRAIQQEMARASMEGREPNAQILDAVDVSRVRRPTSPS